MCNFIPTTTDMILRVRAYMALVKLPCMFMEDKGTIDINNGPFSNDVQFKFKDQPDRRVNANTFLDSCINGDINTETANTLISSGVSFGPGEIYYKNQLVYKLELCDESHAVRLDTPKDDEAKAIAGAYKAIKFFINKDVLEICDNTLRFVGLPDALVNIPNPFIDATVNLRDTLMAILAIDGDDDIIHPFARAVQHTIQCNLVIANKPMVNGKYFPMELLAE